LKTNFQKNLKKFLLESLIEKGINFKEEGEVIETDGDFKSKWIPLKDGFFEVETEENKKALIGSIIQSSIHKAILKKLKESNMIVEQKRVEGEIIIVARRY